MKKCSKCKIPKDETEFSAHARPKDGLQAWCKPCVLAYNRGRLSSCPEKVRAIQLKSRKKDVLKRRAYDKLYRNAHPEKALERGRRWRKRNPRNDMAREKTRVYKRNRYKNSVDYRVSVSIRSRLGLALNKVGAKKSASTIALLGCPWVWLEAHLESLFKPGMTWENHGPVWHIDHIRPCASFNLSDPEQQKICCHWTNLQPLFAIENLLKGDTYIASKLSASSKNLTPAHFPASALRSGNPAPNYSSSPSSRSHRPAHCLASLMPV